MQFCFNRIVYFQVIEQTVDEKLGRTVTRVVLPRVVMHSRYHYGVLTTYYAQHLFFFPLNRKYAVLVFFFFFVFGDIL